MIRRLWKNESGSVAVYVAFFTLLAVSAGSISIDLGRLITLKTQLQHRADAGALAGAVQLNGTSGAMERARDVANNATTDSSNISSDSGEFAVGSVNFYSEYSPTKIAATGDADARVIEVTMTPELVDFFFTPFFSLLIGTATAETQNVNAYAVAQYAPIMCHAPPLMVCDLTESGGEDVMDESSVGKQMLVKFPQGGNSLWAPGNFGLLESGYGTGANNLERALADVEPPGCDSTIVTTEPGTMANRVKLGINARFNGSDYYTPAPNTQTYPRDQQLDANNVESVNSDRLGDADWDPDTYWAANHGGADLPHDLNNASRYQTYLYELGETFARKGLQTIYPVEDDMDSGFRTVTPSGEDIPASGEPDAYPASNGALRRVMQVAVLKCVAEEVKGRGDYPTDGNYIEVFITEPVGDPPDTSIYGEIIGKLDPDASMDFHSNAQMVE